VATSASSFSRNFSKKKKNSFHDLATNSVPNAVSRLCIIWPDQPEFDFFTMSENTELNQIIDGRFVDPRKLMRYLKFKYGADNFEVKVGGGPLLRGERRS
jgi:hypothetical protein